MLTPKQQKFIEVYLETGSQVDAYKAAYKTDNMAYNTIRVKAHELLHNGNITERLNEINARKEASLVVNSERVTQELHEAYEVAKSQGNAQGMVAAALGKAKVNGILIDKQQVTHQGQSPEAWLEEYKRDLEQREQVSTTYTTKLQ